MNGTLENRVIAHFVDGTLVRGTTLDFFPTKRVFHVTDEDGACHEIDMGALKAVFFVHRLEGRPDYSERKGFFRPPQGRKVMVEFVDGEVIFGYTLSYSVRGLGFFLFPGDPQSNNIKVFVVHAATRRVKVKTDTAPWTSRMSRAT